MFKWIEKHRRFLRKDGAKEEKKQSIEQKCRISEKILTMFNGIKLERRNSSETPLNGLERRCSLWLLILLLPFLAFANDYPLRQGPPGPQGLSGIQGEDADANSTKATLGADILWYDWKNIGLKTGYRFDAIHGGHTIDMLAVQIKVGRSYQDREIEKLRNLVNYLTAHIAAREREPVKATIKGSK